MKNLANLNLCNFYLQDVLFMYYKVLFKCCFKVIAYIGRLFLLSVLMRDYVNSAEYRSYL